MKTQTEQYLDRATRGLWGRKRLEVREELGAHLEGRVSAYRIAGLSEADAVERALAELGSPQHVSVGMARLYTLPTVMGSSLAAAAVCAAVVALLPSGAARSLSAILYWPSPRCVATLGQEASDVQADKCIKTGELWVSKEALRDALEPQGVKFKALFSTGTLLKFDLPSSRPIYVPTGSPDTQYFDGNGEVIPAATNYLPFWKIVQTVALQEAAPITIQGWDTPTVRFGDVSLQIGTRGTPITGREFYESYLWDVFADTLTAAMPHSFTARTIGPRRPKGVSRKDSAFRETVLRVPGEAAGVYGVVVSVDPKGELIGAPLSGQKPTDTAFIMQVARASGGTVTARLPKTQIEFAEKYGALTAPGMAVVVRLAGGDEAGKGWYEIIPPDDITFTTQN